MSRSSKLYSVLSIFTTVVLVLCVDLHGDASEPLHCRAKSQRQPENTNYDGAGPKNSWRSYSGVEELVHEFVIAASGTVKAMHTNWDLNTGLYQNLLRYLPQMDGDEEIGMKTALERLREIASSRKPGILSRVAPDVELEAKLPLCKVVERRGFGCEEHYVTTDDGYILGLFHVMPRGWSRRAKGIEPRPAVLLMHGILDSTFSWLNNLEHQSLGYVLTTAGFDVWIGNVRGNTYSRNHTHLKPSQKAFWWFTFDDHARYDLNSTILYVLAHTGQQKLAYVGFSQGSAMMFAALSTYSDISARISFFAALAPVSRVSNIGGFFHLIPMRIAINIINMFETMTDGEVLAHYNLTTDVALDVCGRDAKLADVCLSAIELMTGFGETCNTTRMPVYLSHFPAGTSVLNVVYWAQQVVSGQFQMMDWGKTLNLIKYHQPNPPLYNLALIRTPLALFTSGRDWFANPEDVAWLKSQLSPESLIFHGLYDKYSHVGFAWSPEAHQDVYCDLISQLKMFI